MGFILLAGFISTIFYSCNLIAFMTTKVAENPLTSIKQIDEVRILDLKTVNIKNYKIEG